MEPIDWYKELARQGNCPHLRRFLLAYERLAARGPATDNKVGRPRRRRDCPSCKDLIPVCTADGKCARCLKWPWQCVCRVCTCFCRLLWAGVAKLGTLIMYPALAALLTPGGLVIATKVALLVGSVIITASTLNDVSIGAVHASLRNYTRVEPVFDNTLNGDEFDPSLLQLGVGGNAALLALTPGTQPPAGSVRALCDQALRKAGVTAGAGSDNLLGYQLSQILRHVGVDSVKALTTKESICELVHRAVNAPGAARVSQATLALTAQVLTGAVIDAIWNQALGNATNTLRLDSPNVTSTIIQTAEFRRLYGLLDKDDWFRVRNKLSPEARNGLAVFWARWDYEFGVFRDGDKKLAVLGLLWSNLQRQTTWNLKDGRAEVHLALSPVGLLLQNLWHEVTPDRTNFYDHPDYSFALESLTVQQYLENLQGLPDQERLLNGKFLPLYAVFKVYTSHFLTGLRILLYPGLLTTPVVEELARNSATFLTELAVWRAQTGNGTLDALRLTVELKAENQHGLPAHPWLIDQERFEQKVLRLSERPEGEREMVYRLRELCREGYAALRGQRDDSEFRQAAAQVLGYRLPVQFTAALASGTYAALKDGPRWREWVLPEAYASQAGTFRQKGGRPGSAWRDLGPFLGNSAAEQGRARSLMYEAWNPDMRGRQLSWLLEFHARLKTIDIVTRYFQASLGIEYTQSELASVWIASCHHVLQTRTLAELSYEASASSGLPSHYVPQWSRLVQLIDEEVRRRLPTAPPWEVLSESYFWALATRPTNLHQRARDLLAYELEDLDEKSYAGVAGRARGRDGRYVGVTVEAEPWWLRGLVVLIGLHFTPGVSTIRELLSLLEYQQVLARERAIVDIRGDLDNQRAADISARQADGRTWVDRVADLIILSCTRRDWRDGRARVGMDVRDWYEYGRSRALGEPTEDEIIAERAALTYYSQVQEQFVRFFIDAETVAATVDVTALEHSRDLGRFLSDVRLVLGDVLIVDGVDSEDRTRFLYYYFPQRERPPEGGWLELPPSYYGPNWPQTYYGPGWRRPPPTLDWLTPPRDPREVNSLYDIAWSDGQHLDGKNHGAGGLATALERAAAGRLETALPTTALLPKGAEEEAVIRVGGLEVRSCVVLFSPHTLYEPGPDLDPRQVLRLQSRDDWLTYEKLRRGCSPRELPGSGRQWLWPLLGRYGPKGPPQRYEPKDSWA